MPHNIELFDTLELCNRAGELLKRVGFIHHQTSMKTEAVYYRWPDRPHLIRVAEHGRQRARTRTSHGWVVAAVTFRGRHTDRAGTISMGENKVESIIALAIGQYFLRSTEEVKS